MPRSKITAPDINDKNKGQRSLELPVYLDRFIPQMRNPEWWFADTWRYVVQAQPFAVVCRDTLINTAASLDWMIVPRDSSKRDALKSEIDYYTKFFQNTGDYDYLDLIQWLCKDMLDIPFGGAAEIGRENDSPNGKVRWIRPLDGGTLFPWPNSDYPVGQVLREDMTRQVFFPYYAIDRMYVSPRTEIRYRGWGMPPPVKIYLTLEALARGDSYYANLLLDTPQVGILDLLDMEKETAEGWVQSWRNTLTGIDPFKIPVLYEHNIPAQFISFTKNPTELMFDKAILRYEAIMAAGYGVGLSDVGIQPTSSGGETLAGSIRQERRSRKNGMAVVKRKIKSFFDFLLPDTLEFVLVDLDDEVSVALGRARLATSTAFGLMIDKGVLEPNEARQQLIADGLVSISIPDTIKNPAPPPAPPTPFGQTPNKRPGMLGNPVPPSGGGHGEVRPTKSDVSGDAIHSLFTLSDLQIQRLAVSVAGELALENTIVDAPMEIVKSAISWKWAMDIPSVVEDLSLVYEDHVRKSLEVQTSLDFVTGKSNTLDVVVDKNKIGLRKFKNLMTKNLTTLVDGMPGITAYCVVNGIAEYEREYGFERELDSGAILVDNRVITSIKNELSAFETDTREGIAQTILRLSDTILEDIYNGSRSSERIATESE